MNFQSLNIKKNGNIPIRYTCDGIDISPAFKWNNIPVNTKSLTLIVDDPDAKSAIDHVFTHFVVINLPIDINNLYEAENFTLIPSATVLRNDDGKFAWKGPCPPKADNAHKYRFTLYALNNILKIPVTKKLTVEIFEQLFNKNILSRSSFIGKYKRK